MTEYNINETRILSSHICPYCIVEGYKVTCTLTGAPSNWPNCNVSFLGDELILNKESQDIDDSHAYLLGALSVLA